LAYRLMVVAAFPHSARAQLRTPDRAMKGAIEE
jgi:hypothetical protein